MIRFTSYLSNLIKSNRTKLTNAEKIQKYFRTQEGGRLDFIEHPYLEAIYNDDSRYMVFSASRQVGKSTLLALDVLKRALSTRNESILFASASEAQLSEIQDDKIRRQFDMNPQLKRAAFNSRSVDNKGKMIFSNQSTIYFKSIGKQVSSARGIAAPQIYFDEVQSIPRAHISVVRASARTFKDTSRFIFAGTFLGEENTLNQLYLDTNQNEWIITCPECHQDNPKLGMAHIDKDLPFLFCVHCKAPLDRKLGRWVKHNPDNPKSGYRICGLMTPECTWRSKAHDGILDLYESEPFDKFLNETMGLPSVKGVNLITRTELEDLCGDEPMLDPTNVPPNIQQRPSVAGIDWAFNTDEGGVSHTMITFALLERDVIKIPYTKRFSGPEYSGPQGPDKVLDEICLLVKAFQSDFVFCDKGLGHKDNMRLQLRLGQKVQEMQYHGGSKPTYWDPIDRCYKIPKTLTLDQVFLNLREQRYLFPRKDDFEPYYEDILNLYTKYDEDHRTRTYVKSGKGSDDFCQLLNLCTIGILRMFGYPPTWMSQSSY